MHFIAKLHKTLTKWVAALALLFAFKNSLVSTFFSFFFFHISHSVSKHHLYKIELENMMGSSLTHLSKESKRSCAQGAAH